MDYTGDTFVYGEGPMSGPPPPMDFYHRPFHRGFRPPFGPGPPMPRGFRGGFRGGFPPPHFGRPRGRGGGGGFRPNFRGGGGRFRGGGDFRGGGGRGGWGRKQMSPADPEEYYHSSMFEDPWRFFFPKKPKTDTDASEGKEEKKEEDSDAAGKEGVVQEGVVQEGVVQESQGERTEEMVEKGNDELAKVVEEEEAEPAVQSDDTKESNGKVEESVQTVNGEDGEAITVGVDEGAEETNSKEEEESGNNVSSTT